MSFTEQELSPGAPTVYRLQSRMNDNSAQLFYPRKSKALAIRSEIMRDAYLEGYEVEAIANYFRVSIFTIYDRVRIKQLKARRWRNLMEKELN